MTRHAKPFLWALCMLSAFATGRMAAQAPSEPQPVYGRALLRTWVPPEYPKDALKERLSARVSLRLVVDAKGVVASSRVLDASDPRFVEAAQSAVKKWAFSPALDASRPVA